MSRNLLSQRCLNKQAIQNIKSCPGMTQHAGIEKIPLSTFQSKKQELIKTKLIDVTGQEEKTKQYKLKITFSIRQSQRGEERVLDQRIRIPKKGTQSSNPLWSQSGHRILQQITSHGQWIIQVIQKGSHKLLTMDHLNYIDNGTVK